MDKRKINLLCHRSGYNINKIMLHYYVGEIRAKNIIFFITASRRISIVVTFQRDVQLTACYKNNLTGTGRCNNI